MKGIWFFGLSGSGKTYASKFLKSKIDKSFIIDGDIVRKNISSDLDYDIKSREIQINRILGITKIVIVNKYFPIISTVYMNKKIANNLKRLDISLYFIKRNMDDIFISHPTYKKNKINIVGKDINYEKFEYKTLKNDEENFCNILIKLTS